VFGCWVVSAVVVRGVCAGAVVVVGFGAVVVVGGWVVWG